MVLDNVADAASLVVERAASGNAELLGHGDLHALDVVAVPHGLEKRVGEAEEEDVLDRVFSEIVIDAEHRVFREHGVQRAVQRTRRLEVVAKRFLDDDARAGRETDAPKTFRDGAEETRWNGEVAGWVGGSAKNLSQRVERGRVAIVAIDVSQHVDQTREVVVARTAAMFVEARTLGPGVARASTRPWPRLRSGP